MTAVITVSGLLTAVPASPATAASQASVGPFTFTVGAYQLRTLPVGELPFYDSSLVASCGITDANGVAMYRISDGTVVDHPVNQARCALNMLRNYRLDPDPSYLDQAVSNANRLLARTVRHAGASFFPYPFDWHNAGRSTMRAPWYSAMAQGLALAAFVRLHEWTGEQRWADAAASTFASFTIARGSGTPWVTGVEGGRLWLDEYPTVPLDRVWNGHNFAIFGLYDYWRTTASEPARRLLLGALHSSYLAAWERGRVPGGISQYCVSDACMSLKVRNPAYHPLHIGQLETLTDLTGHWHFASLAEAFQADSPRPSSGTASLAAGTHDGYRFDATGIGTRAVSVTLTTSERASYVRREVPGDRDRPGNGIWLRISSGALSGFWVRESSRAWPVGTVDRLAFIHGRTVQVPAGSYTGTTYAPDGTVTEASSVDSLAAAWSYRSYARINGRPSVLLASGPLVGRWLALDARTLRDSTLFSDIDPSAFRTDIIWLTNQGITRGCAAYRYCPGSHVTREQMASFLVRALRLPPAPRDFFTDDAGRITERDINSLAAAGIAAGCGSGRFCPTRPVTRAEMASFLVRALKLPPASTDFFADDGASVHQADINRLAASGITRGCSANRYCPDAFVTRGEMAAFLRRALSAPALTASTGGTSTQDGPVLPSPSPVSAATPSAPPSPAASPSASPTPIASPEPSPTPEPSAEPPTTDPSPTPSVLPGSPTPEPSASPP